MPNLRSAAVARPAGPAQWFPMIFIGLAISLVIMDATIVNVSLPAIITDLHVSSIDAEWINAIYSLVFATFLIMFGRLGDRFGRRRLMVIGVSVFALASAVAGLSGSGAALITARAVQGIGGAMIAPTTLSLVNAMYAGRARTVAFAIYGSIIGGMAALGPLLGGFFTEYHSWRWVFYVNLPIALVVVVGGLRLVPESRETRFDPGTDVWGIPLSALGIGALVFALIEGRNYGWWTATGDIQFLFRTWPAGGVSPVLLALVVSGAGLALFLVNERRRAAAGRSVLLDLRLFRIATFSIGSLAALIVSLGELGLLFSLPLFLQNVQGYGAMGAGALLATLAAGAFVSAPAAAALAEARSPRFVARLGMAVEVVAIAGLGLTLAVDTGAWVFVGWLFLYGMGVGLATAQLTGLILADVPVGQSGQASGTQSTARQIGSALGTAVLGTVLFVTLGTQTAQHAATIEGVSTTQAQQVADTVQQSAGTAIPSLAAQPSGTALVAAASEAFTDALRSTAFTAAGFVLLGLLATMFLPAVRAEPVQADRAPDPADRHAPLPPG